MKKFFSRYFPVLPVILILGIMIFSHSCANTTTPPSGGAKDTIPPVITKISPLPGAVNVPTHNAKITFTFDEYVVVKDQKNIFLSPPLAKAPKYKIRGKSVIVYFESDLDTNTTYTLDLTGAIADNNENNKFPGYTMVFSTGPHIDSMMVTGVVQDCNTLKPVAGATVMLYKDQADSAVMLHRPSAAVKTDDWGFFCLRNIKDTVYRMYAIKDDNNDNIYQNDNELVAFLDTLIRPSIRVNDSLPELKKYDMKDTALCLARKTQVELNLFREKPSKQMIVNKVRVGVRTAYITFMAPGAQVKSLWVKGLPKNKLITQFNIQKDSLEIWINDQRRLPDTLRLYVDYKRTDSLNVLRDTIQECKLVLDKKLAMAAKSSRRDIKHEDTTCVITTTADPTTVEQYGITMEFKYPLIKAPFDQMTFRWLNPKQQEFTGRFTVTRDSLNLRKYTIRPQTKLMTGYDYYLKIPQRIFQDVNGSYNDSSEVKFTLPTDDKLSTLTLNLTGVGNSEYIVDLLNEQRSNVIRTYIVDRNQSLIFPYLKAGKYTVRITEDPNRNGIVDTGILLQKKQPERVKLFKIKDSYLIDIPEMTELSQDINLKEMFK
jgi:hypothetical protein